MLTTQLLPIALRGILPENVRLAIVKVCAFLNQISQKAIRLRNLVKLQNDAVECLVSFEMIFPPSFFTIMTHLLVHLVEEIFILMSSLKGLGIFVKHKRDILFLDFSLYSFD